MSSTVEYVVCQDLGNRTEELSSGHFEVGRDFGGGVVFWPDEESARIAATEYAKQLAALGGMPEITVIRKETSTVEGWQAS